MHRNEDRLFAIIYLQRGILRERASPARADYVSAFYTHRVSLLPIE